MLARPLYDDKKPQVKFAPKTKSRPPASRAPHLVLLAIPVLLVLCIGGAVAARYMKATPAEEQAQVQEPAAQPGPAATNQAGASSPSALPQAPATASAEASKAPALSQPKQTGPELPVLDEFRGQVLSDADAADRMKRILSLLDKGTSYEKAGAYHALLSMKAFAVQLLPAQFPTANERTLPWLCDAAGELKAKDAVRPMITKALENPAKTPRNLVAAVGKLATDESREFCLQSMKQERYPVLRQWAWEAFVHCAKNDDLALLSQALEKGEGYQQQCAADAMGRLARSADVAAQLERQLTERLSTAQDKAQRAAIVRALVALPANVTQSVMGTLVHDGDPEIRILVVKGLARDPFTAGQLCAMIQIESEGSVQIAIMKALAETPQTEAVPHLLKLLDSTTYDVSKAAQKALIAAYGVDYGYRAAPWKSWLALGEAEGDRNRLKVFQTLERKRQAERLAALQAGQLVSGN